MSEATSVARTIDGVEFKLGMTLYRLLPPDPINERVISVFPTGEDWFLTCLDGDWQIGRTKVASMSVGFFYASRSAAETARDALYEAEALQNCSRSQLVELLGEELLAKLWRVNHVD